MIRNYATHRDWDRIITYMLFVAYGIYSLAFPLISVERASPAWIEGLLGLEFIFAGASMLYGLLKDQWMVWKMGMTVAFIGLSTITLVIGFVGGARVLAYAFLFGAFAMQSLYGIRRERKRRNEQEVIDQLQRIIDGARLEEPR